MTDNLADVAVGDLDELKARRPTRLVRIFRNSNGQVVRVESVPMPDMWKRAV